jgi:hypothetical protein
MRKAILFFATTILAQGADKIIGGPYVVNVTPRSATVAWVVQTGEVTIGAAPDKVDKTVPILRTEKVTFTGLQPGTAYYVDPSSRSVLKASFKTQPVPNTPAAEAFQFVLYGDTRTRHDVHRKVIEAVLKYSNPDFVLHTGDLVENGDDPTLWPIFFDVERDLLRKVAFYPSLGNHERNSRQYYEFFDSTSPYYSFNWGSAHFAVINSDINNMSASLATRRTLWNEQVRWLEEDLQKNNKADFRFVVAHHPPFTAVTGRQAGNPDMEALVPIFEKYKVTAGLFGHDHNYQHYLKNGIHYFTSGGGGAPLYDVDRPPAGITQKVVRVENFLVFKVSGKTVHVEAIGVDGKALDSTDLKP